MKTIKKKIKNAFTLIELVVVIAVIAILSAVSVAAYMGVISSANKSVAEQEAKQIVTSITTVTTSEPVTAKDVFTAEMTNSGLEISFIDQKTTYDSTVDTSNYADVNLIGIFDYLLQVSEGTTPSNFSLPTSITSLTTTATNISKFYGKATSTSPSKTAIIYGFDYTYKQQVSQVVFSNGTIGTDILTTTTTTTQS